MHGGMRTSADVYTTPMNTLGIKSHSLKPVNRKWFWFGYPNLLVCSRSYSDLMSLGFETGTMWQRPTHFPDFRTKHLKSFINILTWANYRMRRWKWFTIGQELVYPNVPESRISPARVLSTTSGRQTEIDMKGQMVREYFRDLMYQ